MQIKAKPVSSSLLTLTSLLFSFLPFNPHPHPTTKKMTPISFLFTLLLSSLTPSTLSLTTTLLDVSSTLQQTKTILSQPQKTPPQTSTTTPPTLSLQLLPRDTLLKPHHKSYKSFLLTRLSRDATRVNSLLARLSLSTPITSGSSLGSGEYFSRLGVGTPSKPYYMSIDTGSDINWLQCTPCSDCYSQSDPIFDPSSSSSYSPLTCDSRECTSLDVFTCRNGHCLYQVNYGDGSSSSGDYVTETLTFGSSGTVPNVALGCGHDNEGLFVGSAGLLGLGGGPLSLTSQINATAFSYCLVDRGSPSTSTLQFNSDKLGEGAVTSPLLRSNKIRTFYYVALTGMSVGGQPLSIPPSVFQLDESGNGGVIVDCGTAITRLQTQAYDSLRDAFRGMTGHLRSTSGVSLFDTCYDLSGLSTVSVPTVTFQFPGNKSWDLPAKNYLIPVDSDGKYCFAFAPTTSSLSIIGNVQQQGTRVSFDLVNNRVGFATNQC